MQMKLVTLMALLGSFTEATNIKAKVILKPGCLKMYMTNTGNLYRALAEGIDKPETSKLS